MLISSSSFEACRSYQSRTGALLRRTGLGLSDKSISEFIANETKPKKGSSQLDLARELYKKVSKSAVDVAVEVKFALIGGSGR